MKILPNSKRSVHVRDLSLSFLDLPNRKRSDSRLHSNKILRLYLCKRSLSTVVASLLMILLVVLAVGIVSQIVIPMIKKDLSSAGNCLDAIGNIQFNKKYTCYDNNKIKVDIEVKKVEVSGFVVNIYGEGNAESYTIKEETTDGKITMSGSNQVELPKENEAKIYEITTGIVNPKTISVSAIVGGETCAEAEQMILDKC